MSKVVFTFFNVFLPRPAVLGENGAGAYGWCTANNTQKGWGLCSESCLYFGIDPGK